MEPLEDLRSTQKHQRPWLTPGGARIESPRTPVLPLEMVVYEIWHEEWDRGERVPALVSLVRAAHDDGV